jgi:hypothetical protein
MTYEDTYMIGIGLRVYHDDDYVYTSSLSFHKQNTYNWIYLDIFIIPNKKKVHSFQV